MLCAEVGEPGEAQLFLTEESVRGTEKWETEGGLEMRQSNVSYGVWARFRVVKKKTVKVALIIGVLQIASGSPSRRSLAVGWVSTQVRLTLAG